MSIVAYPIMYIISFDYFLHSSARNNVCMQIICSCTLSLSMIQLNIAANKSIFCSHGFKNLIFRLRPELANFRPI